MLRLQKTLCLVITPCAYPRPARQNAHYIPIQMWETLAMAFEPLPVRDERNGPLNARGMRLMGRRARLVSSPDVPSVLQHHGMGLETVTPSFTAECPPLFSGTKALSPVDGQLIFFFFVF